MNNNLGRLEHGGPLTHKECGRPIFYPYNDKKRFNGMRDIVLNRDKYSCVKCGMTDAEHRSKWGCSITVDHIDGNGAYVKKALKNNAIENLQTLCLRCHGLKDSLKKWGGISSNHCKNGHEFTKENTILRANGVGRKCRQCNRILGRRYWVRKKLDAGRII